MNALKVFTVLEQLRCEVITQSVGRVAKLNNIFASAVYNIDKPYLFQKRRVRSRLQIVEHNGFAMQSAYVEPKILTGLRQDQTLQLKLSNSNGVRLTAPGTKRRANSCLSRRRHKSRAQRLTITLPDCNANGTPRKTNAARMALPPAESSAYGDGNNLRVEQVPVSHPNGREGRNEMK
ncbi:MAG: hypothetical protein ACFHXK_18880 [bacterium]